LFAYLAAVLTTKVICLCFRILLMITELEIIIDCRLRGMIGYIYYPDICLESPEGKHEKSHWMCLRGFD
jgi:sigma54-dependent transcription regulator